MTDLMDLKTEAQIPMNISCDDCGSKVVITFGRKNPKIRVTCEECGVTDRELVEYGGGAVVGNIEVTE